MFVPARASSPPKRSASHSTDDHASTRDGPRRLYQRHAHDLDSSSYSLTFSSSLHDDLPTPSAPTHAIHSTSAHSTPMTSPSTGYSLFPGSISSATSESAPSTGYRSEFGLLPSPSPVHGSPSSRSSNHISPRSHSTTESDTHPLPSHFPPKCSSRHSSSRPSTAPHSPSTLTLASNAADKPSDHHRRSHSRFTTSIKNLLSRPAPPSFSRFAFNSLTTPRDNNTSSRSSQASPATGKHAMAPRKPRPPNLQVPGSLATADTPSPSLAPSSPMDSHRRYASEAVAKIYNDRADTVAPTSQDSLDFSARNATPVTPRGREPKTRNVLRRRPSGSAKLLRGRERGLSVPSRTQQGDADHPPLSPNQGTPRSTQAPLTPAGAVVEAYKQQELYRDDALSPPKLSIDARMSPRASHLSGYDRDHSEHSPSPYSFTMGSPEHRVQPGGLGDRWGDGSETNPRPTSRTTSSHQPSASDPSSRSITRKVSSRWRKAKGGGVAEELPAREKRHSKGRPSLHEIWANDKSSTRAKGRSMDSMPNTGDGVWSSPTEGHSGPESEKMTSSEGGKLWRLMRRISTGGLRDRLDSDKTVPPVPAIPKGLLEKVNQGEHDNEPVLTPSYQPSSSHDKDHPSLSTTPNNITTSTAIGSSSSNSSDVASMSFFRKTHSARSSISSYGEGLATSRTPETALDRHIIAPIEQLRLDEDHVESGKVPRSPRRSASVPAGLRKPDAEGDHTPLPSPRRLTTCSGESPPRASSRPSSTSVCASGSPHVSYQSHGVGIGPPRMADGIVSLSPPPRPARSSKRTESAMSSPSHSMLAKQTDGGTGIGLGGARQMDRTPSARSDMTARPSSESRELRRSGDQDASARTHTQLTFRELGTPRRPPLSEQEKVDIWNNLLDRSDKAGGTLHINGAEELMSDNMRFSTHSEAL